MKHNEDNKREPTPGWEERIEAAYLRIKAGLPRFRGCRPCRR